MNSVFLSYAREDGSAAASRLRGELERAGFAVWRDIEDMQGGLAWRDQLREALRGVDAVLVLLTPKAVQSQAVTWEWENAMTLQKRVIPLLILPCSVPPELDRLHYHRLDQPEGYTLAFAALVRDLTGPRETSPSNHTSPGGGYTVINPHQSAIGPGATVINHSHSSEGWPHGSGSGGFRKP